MKKSTIHFWKTPALLATLGLGLVFSSCEDDTDPPMIPEEETVVDIAANSPDFTTLTAAVNEAGLTETLSQTGPFTVFAPTDGAFNDFLAANNLTADELLADPDLASILTYHVIGGSVVADQVSPGAVTPLNDIPFYVSEDPDGNLWINGNTQVIDTDIMADNGIIHVLDYVITPPTQNIAEIAIESTEAAEPEFTQLVAALLRADLAGSVSGDMMDDLTVFAPTDAAFEDLYAALGVSGVDEIPVETLTDVLLYHVVPARAFSQDLRDGASLPTLLEGEELTVNLADLEINESGLIAEALNIHATNGVIHAIDQVLLPPSDESSARITLANEGASAYLIESIDGEGASGELDTENTGIELTEGLRYTFVNNGGANHPLDFRNADGDILLAEDGTEGTFEDDADVNFAVDGSSISFTLTAELAAVIATYNCTVHSVMEGAITIAD
ncbi:fasciclin domain-containing protein [Algoriphagus hitonicola]|uniref:Uncaracterized surface protein containing fasciclin (FAS1) repeats n=1 Tax=Algoriphagus hitonicola TaxID=435880 RepID=A0A1I2XSF5_9BACT|nr:fasciclin domain-containing protein [Algoriphagus hitonicola]SFH15031.1 Uncaracterized surface protein containing fasciclin (FAS1) repeats [Algoriphagus hitonicola]